MVDIEQKLALSMIKIFWLITEDKYEKLRTIEGCDSLLDLKATVNDGKHILAIADAIGVQDEYRYINVSSDVAGLKKNYMTILKLSKQLSLQNKRHLVFVYVGGHGATDNEKQIFLLNSDEPKSAQFHIEFKLRYIANDPTSKVNIFAVFDCCRVNLKNMPGLVNARGAGGGDDFSDESEAEEPCKYF